MKYTRFFTVLGLFACVALAGCADTDRPATDPDESSEVAEPTQPANTILTVAEDAGLTTFRTAVAQAGLDETLGGPGPFTVFAPSDEAFNALPEGTLESLLETGNRDQLRQILTYHVLPRQIMSGDLSGEMSIASQEGQSLTISAADGNVRLTDAMGNTANVVSADTPAGNGVIHVIDSVLMPGEGEPAADTTAGM